MNSYNCEDINTQAHLTKVGIEFPSVSVPTGKWVHLAITVDPAQKKAYCYIDGKQVGTYTNTYTDARSNFAELISEAVPTHSPMVLGADQRGDGTPYFKGSIASLAVYSDKRTETEIKADMIAPGKENLLVHYEIESETNHYDDLSGNGYHISAHSVYHQITSADLTGLDTQSGVYTASVKYDPSDKIALNLGNKEIFSLNNNIMKLCGSQVDGSYGEGTYTVKVKVNTVQQMLMVEVKLPDGEPFYGRTVMRGTYDLITKNSASYTITAWGYDDTDVDAVGEIQYTTITKDAEGVPEDEVAGLNDPVIADLVTSFSDARTTRLFNWTNTTNAAMTFRYTVKDKEAWTTVGVPVAGDHGSKFFFKTEITGLNPGTTYTYQIGRDDTWSNSYEFTTASNFGSSFTFAALGDTQSYDWSDAKYAYAAYNKIYQSNPAFILHNGDMVNADERSTSSEAEWNLFFKALGKNGATTPHFAAIGNHDTWANSGKEFNLYFNHPNVGSTERLNGNTDSANHLVANSDETFYSFDYGDAHFIVLHSGEYRVNPDKQLQEAQRDWLVKDLEANKHAKWTIVMTHQPVHHRLDEGEDAEYSRDYLSDVFESYGVDLVIQGHSHLVTRTYPMGLDESGKPGKILSEAFVNSDPNRIVRNQGTVYVTVGSTVTTHDSMGNPNMDQLMLIATPEKSQAAYTSVTVSENSLTMTIKQLDGLVLDSFTIEGASDSKAHNFSDKWTYDANNHWHVCDCGDMAGVAAHVDDGNDADHNCDYCGKENVTECNFNKEVVDTKYLNSAATCTNKAVYYKSCACGLASEEDTFENGDSLGHSYTTKASTSVASPATCKDYEKYYVQCDRCTVISDTQTVDGTTLNPENHANKQTVEANPAGCTTSGKTAGVYCPDCETWLTEQETIPAKGHIFMNYEEKGDHEEALCANGCGKVDIRGITEDDTIIVVAPSVEKPDDGETTEPQKEASVIVESTVWELINADRQKYNSMEIRSDVANMTFNWNALIKIIETHIKGDEIPAIEFVAQNITDSENENHKNKLVFDFYLSINGEKQDHSDFGETTQEVEVEIPLNDWVIPEGKTVKVSYVERKTDGTVERTEMEREYDRNGNRVKFWTSHFSEYEVEVVDEEVGVEIDFVNYTVGGNDSIKISIGEAIISTPTQGEAVKAMLKADRKFTVVCSQSVIVAYTTDGSNYTIIPKSATDVNTYELPSEVSGNIQIATLLRGDINLDGKINSKDLTRLEKYIAETIELEKINQLAADTKVDEKVNSKDITRLEKHLAGSITTFD